MNSVYKEIYHTRIRDIPVFNIYNIEQFGDEIAKRNFFLYNINTIISNYNKGGDNYGFIKNAKKNISK